MFEEKMDETKKPKNGNNRSADTPATATQGVGKVEASNGTPDTTTADTRSLTTRPNRGSQTTTAPVEMHEPDVLLPATSDSHGAPSDLKGGKTVPMPPHGRRSTKKNSTAAATNTYIGTRDKAAAIRDHRRSKGRTTNVVWEEPQSEDPNASSDLPAPPEADTTQSMDTTVGSQAVATQIKDHDDDYALNQRRLVRLGIIMTGFLFLVVAVAVVVLIVTELGGDDSNPLGSMASTTEAPSLRATSSPTTAPSTTQEPTLRDTSSPTTTPIPTNRPQDFGPVTVEAFGQTYDSSNTTIIDMVNDGLTGPIPSILGRLTALAYLVLDGNQLTGPIPSELGRLTELAGFHLQHNQLTGPIPSELGRMTALTYLGLYDNQLTGPVPSELGKLTELVGLDLDLSTNQLTGPIPSELGGLTAVTSLRLSGNTLTGPIPSELGRLTTALASLWLQSNQLTGPIPSQLGRLAALADLYLSNNQWTGPIPSQLGRLTASTALSLSSNQLTGSIPSELGTLIALAYLSLSTNQLTGPIPSELGRLTALSGLLLFHNQLTGSIPSSICGISSLIHLGADCEPDPFPLQCNCGSQCKCDD